MVVELAPEFRQEGQNVDVRGPGHGALVRMGLLDAVKAKNTGEQAWTFVNGDNQTVASFDQEAFGADGPTADLEILRGDLASIRRDACGPAVDWRYGDHIAELSRDGDTVDVQFANGGSDRFDLVVVAKGAGAQMRKLAFGDEARVKPWNLDMGFSIPKGDNTPPRGGHLLDRPSIQDFVDDRRLNLFPEPIVEQRQRMIVGFVDAAA